MDLKKELHLFLPYDGYKVQKGKERGEGGLGYGKVVRWGLGALAHHESE